MNGGKLPAYWPTAADERTRQAASLMPIKCSGCEMDAMIFTYHSSLMGPQHSMIFVNFY